MNDVDGDNIDTDDYSAELAADPFINDIHTTTDQSSTGDETSRTSEGPISPLVETTRKIVDKFFYPETKLNLTDEEVFTVLTQLRRLVLDDLINNPSGNKNQELEDRLYNALDSAMREAHNRRRHPRPDLWLVYAYKDLMVKVNPKPTWRSLINMLNSTEMVLNITQRFYNEKHQLYNIDQGLERQIRQEAHMWLKEYLVKNFIPFLEEMGGWADIHDYYRYHTSDPSSGGMLAKVAMVGLAAVAFSGLINRLSNS